MPVTRRQRTQSKTPESEGEKILETMPQDDFDPSMVPLPSSDNTIYAENEIAQENEFHESADMRGDYESDDEFEDDVYGDGETAHAIDQTDPTSYDGEDHEMSSEQEDEQQGEDEETYEQRIRYHRDSLQHGGKVKNHRESGASIYSTSSLYHQQEAQSPTGSSGSHEYNSERNQEQLDAEELEEDEHEDLDKTIRFDRFASSLLPLDSVSHKSTPSRAQDNTSSMTPKPFGSLFATPKISPSPTTYFGSVFPTTPFLSQSTPIGRLTMTANKQAVLENQVLMSQLKDREAHIKYLEGLIETSADAGEILNEFVSFSPEKKRPKIMTTPRPAVMDQDEQLTVKKKRTQKPGTPGTTTKLFPVTPEGSIRRSSVKSRSPSKLFATSTVFDTTSILGSPSIRQSFTASLPPLPLIKSAKERKEEKRRRMTKEFREFSEISLDKLRSWMPPVDPVVEEVEEEANKENAVPNDVDGDKIMEDVDQQVKEELLKKQSPVKQSPVKVKSAIAEWEAKQLDMTNFTVPEPIPERPLFSYEGGPVKPTSRKRANSAPPVLHAPVLTPEEEEAAESADYTISPIAQEMITALQNRILALEHELDTTNGALQKAMAHLVGEQRARKQAEEVKEFLEMEKEFGVCCKHAQEYSQRTALRKQITGVSQDPASAPIQTASQGRSALTATQPPVQTVNARKRTRDESEKGMPTRGGSKLGHYPPEKKRVSASGASAVANHPPTRQTRHGQNASTSEKPTIGLAKKPVKASTTAAYEKPALRAPARPKSRIGMNESENMINKYGNKAPERPSSRLGNRSGASVDRYGGNLINTTETKSGSRPGERKEMDVFGRLAAGGRSRR